MKLALFDLDHTLIPFDSDHAWGDFCCTLGWVDTVHHKSRNAAFYADYKAGTLDIYAYLDFALAPLVGKTAEQLAQAHAQFMQQVVQAQLRPSALELVASHRARGHTCVVVTATNAFITRPIAAAFGISELLAVDLQQVKAADSGYYTGKPQGVLTYQAGKVTRVEQYLAERNLRLADCETWFYSDSINDLALLKRVTYAIATNPDAPLLEQAKMHSWQVLELYK